MKMILDLDTGIDDALALAYALSQPQVDLIGVTTTYGNVETSTSIKNTLNILDLFGRSDVPVFAGSRHNWVSTENYVPAEIIYKIHGRNGIGEVELGEAKRKASEMSAVDFILASAKEYGAELTLVTTGPITNLADAIKADKDTVKKIGRIVAMGGALTIPGNVSPFAEANIANDPEAAKFIFASDVPIVIVGLDVTLTTMIYGDDITSWYELDTAAGKALADMSMYYYQNEYDDAEVGGAMHDPLAVEVAINPDIVKDILPINLTVETEGPSRGRTIADIDGLNRAEKSAQVCLQVDADAFIERFTTSIHNLIAETKMKAVS